MGSILAGALRFGAWNFFGAWSLVFWCAPYSTENSEEPRYFFNTPGDQSVSPTCSRVKAVVVPDEADDLVASLASRASRASSDLFAASR